ncbi:hypothetical protein VTK56DRAFT_4490 [Thermocarpiscus australiensis]
MAPATASVPRFLLPQSGLIWRRRLVAGPRAPCRSGSGSASASASASASPRVSFRLFSRSSSKPSKSAASNPTGQPVLAKPERFTPPSHGSRLPKKAPPRHYGGDLSAEEVQTQKQKDYPGMMAPEGTWAYWFWHSRWIHVVLTVGTLSGLAIWTFALNFKHTSPFADMLPSWGDYLRHPLGSARMLVEVLRLHEAHKTARIAEKRKRYVDDVAKRAAYRRAHGLPEEMGLFQQPMAKIKSGEEGEGQGEAAAAAAEAGGAGEQGQEQASSGPQVRRLTEEEREQVVKEVKGKRLGIF